MDMHDAWFSVEHAGYFAFAGGLALTALVTPMVLRGRHRGAVITLWGTIIALGLALLAGGVIALTSHQPYHVTAPLLITGATIAAAYSFTLIFILRTYRKAEQRKVAAREL